MESMFKLLFGMIFVAAIIKAVTKKKARKITRKQNNISLARDDEKFHYKRRNLFTQTEYRFFKKLEPHAEEKSLLIFPKVRVADIADVNERGYTSEWQTAFNKINRKHVDFVLCDKQTLHIKYIIELDDYTHTREDRQERDVFVDEVMEQCGFQMLHFPVEQEYDFSAII